MSWIKHDGGYPRGYGEKDGRLADAVFNAPDRKAADKAARADGHKDTEGAAAWLASRSGDGQWVG